MKLYTIYPRNKAHIEYTRFLERRIKVKNSLNPIWLMEHTTDYYIYYTEHYGFRLKTLNL